MRVTHFFDAIALLAFAQESLSGRELKQRLSELPPWVNWDDRKLLEDCYRSTRRLRTLGLIEEVEKAGSVKPFQLTAIGQDDVDEILKTFGEFYVEAHLVVSPFKLKATGDWGGSPSIQSKKLGVKNND